MQRLTASTTPASALQHHRALGAPGIVHLGLGNFHRAHQAVHTARALEHADGPWAIIGVAHSSATVAEVMREQDLRYGVVEISPERTEVVVPAVHSDVLVAAQQPQAVLDALAAQETRIVTLTITEKGYTYSPRTKNLDLDNPDVRTDLAGGLPRTTIGRLARALQRRTATHAAPVTILSCDNLTGNGDLTGRLVREFAAALPAAEREDLLSYLDTSVSFPNGMVDRIVPATTDTYRAAVADRLGLRDEVPVPAEPFSMWVLEDRFAAGRPAWEHGGVTFTDDVEPYELMKLRLLNGTHSLIAYLGALDGCDLIAEATARPHIAEAARQLMRSDYLPTLTMPADVDFHDYSAQLFTRWSNTSLGHRTRQVGSDGSNKLAQRVPEPAAMHLQSGRMPHHLALCVAAYLRATTAPGTTPHTAALVDPAAEALRAKHAESTGTADFVSAALRGGLLGDELAEHQQFQERVAELVDVLTAHGVAAASQEALQAQR
ncbi:mannitol dehydrogenase family protein [Saccharopolyspora rhizosphaerae]|uniref:Mannitol-1-phosphate 5-dehydrogenase n=1 Tax=Saccharopolyspora rhizosphaerae TaxID=2492662 RepID=A0A426K4M9_9PSEU|nr:mannitol dehydrogenase family protein [Saccharopolyspora rhizosphaerae]RRO20447.1 mannitol dehydrogenase family protein [Saccharopolyspora rhizosphaerae]